MTRAAIYARYSSDLQSDASIDDQVRLCRARITQEGWTEAALFSDRATSGASSLRPGYQSLLEAARGGGFDVIVAEALDRLSRNLSEVARLYNELSFHGIRLFTLSEGEITELHVGLKGTMNALFLKDLADKTRRGLEGRVRQGLSGGGRAYGYDVVKKTDAHGEPLRGERQINEREAEIVRRIAKAFIAGSSPTAIAKQLNEEGVPGPNGRPWQDTAIRGHRTRGTGLLNNDLYIGKLVWNRLRYVKDPSTGKRISRINPQDKWVTIEVPELRILSDDEWAAIKHQQDIILGSPGVQKARDTRFWERKRAHHLLTRKAFCGVCGGQMAAVGKNYLGCNRARKQGTCSNTRTTRRDEVETQILKLLKNELMKPEHVEEFITAFNAEAKRLAGSQTRERDLVLRELDVVERKIASLIDAIADGLRAHGLQAKLDELEGQKATLTAKAAAMEVASAPVFLHPNLGELYRSKITALGESLKDKTLRDEALTIIRQLIDRVTLTPKGPARGDGWDIVLEGEICHLVALGNSTKPGYDKAALDERTASSVKVVAGTGFEPVTFRL